MRTLVEFEYENYHLKARISFLEKQIKKLEKELEALKSIEINKTVEKSNIQPIKDMIQLNKKQGIIIYA